MVARLVIAIGMKRMRAFYVDGLGYKVEWAPDPENLYLTSGTDNLALHYAPDMTDGGALDHLGIILKTAKDVDKWADYLKSRKFKLEKEPKTHRDGARSFYLKDPEGNVLQFIHHPPISK
jgi:catechol 2,3-dioxygenase-like lactoylglutathione lyase family enzyme